RLYVPTKQDSAPPSTEGGQPPPPAPHGRPVAIMAPDYSLLAIGTRITGQLRLGGSQLMQGIWLQDAEVKGGVYFYPLADPEVGRTVEQLQTRIEGQVDFLSTKARLARFEGSWFGAGLDLYKSEFEGDLSFLAWTPPAGLLEKPVDGPVRTHISRAA